jgi:F0F1-type ATP synthase assembly protein I
VKTPEPGGGKTPGPMRYAGLGIQLAVSLLVFVLIGQWLDRKLGTKGILTVVAAFVGFGGTMYSLIRSLNRKDGGDE